MSLTAASCRAAPDVSWEAVAEAEREVSTVVEVCADQYRPDGESIVLRTTDGTELARFVELFGSGSLMAFEVDEIDYEWHKGWSVLIEGRVEKIDDPDELHRLHDGWPRPWASGARNLTIRVTPVAVTGRQLGQD